MDSIDTIINKNLKEALTQVGGHYCDGCDVYLEIPAFFILPGNENYGAFGLDIRRSQFESSLKFIRAVNKKELDENHVRICFRGQAEQFDLTDKNFKEKIINFLCP